MKISLYSSQRSVKLSKKFLTLNIRVPDRILNPYYFSGIQNTYYLRNPFVKGQQ